MKSCLKDHINNSCVSQYFNVEDHFNKKFEIKSNSNWPIPQAAFSGAKQNIPDLLQKKKELNSVKGQLDAFPLEEWSKYTKSRDPSGLIIGTLKKHCKPELLTQVPTFILLVCF